MMNRVAVREWLHDPATAEVQYGHISDWDTSQVRDMSRLFRTDLNEENSFNSDLSRWNVARVTDMSHMFENACAFQSDLS
jgi:surface protein